MPNSNYKGRDKYNLDPNETEYYTAPCCNSTLNTYGTQYGPYCQKPLERFTSPKKCSCYGTSQQYGSSKTCSCKNLPTRAEALTGVI